MQFDGSAVSLKLAWLAIPSVLQYDSDMRFQIV